MSAILLQPTLPHHLFRQVIGTASNQSESEGLNVTPRPRFYTFDVKLPACQRVANPEKSVFGYVSQVVSSFSGKYQAC